MEGRTKSGRTKGDSAAWNHFSPCLSLFCIAQDWLTKFGYLPPPDPVTGQLQTQEELAKAITAMQQFGGLEATGILGQFKMQCVEAPLFF